MHTPDSDMPDQEPAIPIEGNSLSKSIDAFLTRQHKNPDSPYTTNLITSRVAVLALIYPAVTEQLGDATMAALSQVYATHYASHHWDINLYGDQFSDLLNAQQHSPKATQFDWKTLANLAKFEYLLCSLYYADSLPADQLREASLEDATAPELASLQGLTPQMLDSLTRRHPLLDAIAPELHNDTCLLLRCNYRFIAIANPETASHTDSNAEAAS